MRTSSCRDSARSEQPHCDEALWGFAVRSGVRWSPAIFPRDDRPQEWEILVTLGAILAGVPAAEVDIAAYDDILFADRAARHGVAAADVMDVTSVARTGPHRRPDDPGDALGRRIR